MSNKMLLFILLLVSACVVSTTQTTTPPYWFGSINQFTPKFSAQLAFNCIDKVPTTYILNPYTGVKVRMYTFPFHHIVAVDADIQLEDIAHTHCNVTLPAGCVGHIYDYLFKTVQASLDLYLMYNIHPIIFVGHSVGGTLAQYMAYHVLQQQGKVQRVETFGSPPVGNRSFNDWVCMHTQCIRHHNVNDPVPHLSSPVFQYHERIQVDIGSTDTVEQLQVYKQDLMHSFDHAKYYGFKRC